MLPRQFHSLILVILIYACLVTQLLAAFQDNLYQAEVQNFLKSVQQRNLLSSFKREGQRNFSNPCSGHIYEFISSILKAEMWTLKMIDATSKIPSGILAGNTNDLGMYDECLSIREQKSGTEIRGRHCIYTLTIRGLKLNFSADLSVCVPSACNSTDVTHLLELIIFKMTNISTLGINSVKATCSRIDPLEWSPSSIIVLTVIGGIILFLLMCTFLDLIRMQLNIQKDLVNTLSKFSVQRSALQILNIKINPASIPALNGIRFLSICWVVMGHAYADRGFSVAIVNKLDAYKWMNYWYSLYVTMAPFAVDSFFTLSGFLMSYLFIKEMKKGEKFNLFAYYLHRYLRLTPAIGMLIIFTIFIIPHLGSGPLWDNTYGNPRECLDNWWIMLLYLQNFVNKDVKCLEHLWYLAVDMQLFWFSPIILYPLSRNPKLGLTILASSFVASIVSVATITAINEYSFFIQGQGGMSMFEDVYTGPHTRAGPWLVGIFLGYTTASNETNLNTVTATLGWIGAVISFGYCTWGFRVTQREDYEYNVIWETIFSTTSRSVWALGLSWIIFASIKGYGGPVTTFLSLPIFCPLAKLSYCIYLVHQLVQRVLTNSVKVSSYFSDFQMFTNFLNDVIVSIVIAFFFSLFFESPMLILEKIMFQKKRREPKNEYLKDNHDGKIKSNNLNNP